MVAFSERHLSSHVRPHCNFGQSTFGVSQYLVDIFSITIRRRRLNVEWSAIEFASRNIRDAPPRVDTRCRLIFGGLALEWLLLLQLTLSGRSCSRVPTHTWRLVFLCDFNQLTTQYIYSVYAVRLIKMFIKKLISKQRSSSRVATHTLCLFPHL